MSTQQALAVVGATIGAVVGGPAGASIGFSIGSTIGGLIDKPDGPSPGDLSAPKIEQGAALPRVYGRYRVPVNPAWVSDFRATANEAPGKGGPPEGSAGYSYSLDVLGTLADGLNVVAMTRIWVNKKLVWTALSDSSPESIAASAVTGSWASVELFTGAPTQMPWAVYETAVGTADAVAYRHQCTIGITDLQCGGSKTPPLVEVEVVTAGTTSYVAGGPMQEVLRLEGEGADGSSAIIDSSVFGRTNTNISQPPTNSTLQAHSGAGSVRMTSTELGNRSYAVSMEPEFRFGSDDFEISAYVYLTDWGGAGLAAVMAQGSSSVSGSFVLYVYTGDGGPETVSGGKLSWQSWPSGVSLRVDDSYNVPYNQWTLVRASRVRGQLTISASGASATAAVADNLNLSSNLSVGQRAGAGYFWGFMDEVSVIKPISLQVDPQTVDLAAIVTAELSHSPSVSLADYDITDLVGIPVRGFMAVGPPAQTIKQLADAFYFDVVPANPIRFVRRGGALAGGIAFADTGAGVDGPAKPFSGLKRENNDEIAAVRGLKYPNVLQDYEAGFERGDRLTTEGPDLGVSQTRVVFEPPEAKGRAITYTLDARAGAHTASFGLSDKYAVLEPGDPWTVTDSSGSSYRLRAVRMAYADGVRQVDWALDDTTALVQTGATSVDYTPSIVVTAPGETTVLLLDIPILRDADNDPGYYMAVSGTGDWTGATVYESLDGVAYTNIATVTTSATIGTTSTALGDWPQPWLIDNKSSVTVSVNGTLASYSFDATIAGTAVPYLIGSEIVYAMTATLVSAGVYTLSGFIRALQGTEWATGTHASGERLVVLQSAGMRRGEREAGELNVEYQFKGVTLGSTLAGATAQAFTDTGIGLKPFAPVDLKKETTDGATVVTWNRRTRLSSTFLGTTEPALGEASESYDVELYDALDALVSSDTVATNQWSASGAAAFEHFLVPVLDIRTISSEQIGIREDAAPNYTFVRQTIAGGLLGESPNLGSVVYQTANDGSELYAVTADITTFSPSSYINAKAVRYTRTSLGSAAATYTAATPGDLHGIAYDGTDIWVTEFYGGNLRKLNKTTLASVATYAVSTGMRSLLHDSGSLWITRDYSNEVIQWNIGTATETQRFPVVSGPSQLLIVGSLLFVRGANEVAAYTAATGALVASVTAPKYAAGMYVVGSYIAAVSGYGIVLIDSATGLEVTRFGTFITYGGTAYSYIRGLAGVVGDTIYVTLGGPGLSNQTIGFDLGAAELTGYTVRVYQKSATVGRGYVAELAL